jgi:hypothetical protein
MGMEIVAEGTREKFERAIQEKVEAGYKILGEPTLAKPTGNGFPQFVYHTQLVYKADDSAVGNIRTD